MRLLALFLISVVVLGAPEAKGTPNRDKLFRALSVVENCRSWNNPGCLRYAKQRGAKVGPRGFAVFKTKQHGEEALRLRIKRGSGQKMSTFLRKYNPGEPGYRAKVLRIAGLKAGDIL